MIKIRKLDPFHVILGLFALFMAVTFSVAGLALVVLAHEAWRNW